MAFQPKQKGLTHQMMTLRHYFEKELFTDIHYHLDYDTSQEVQALEGSSYQQYIHREGLDFLSRKLIAQYYRPPFFRDIKHGCCRTEMTWLGERIINFLVNHNEKIRYQGADLEFNRYRPDLDLLQQIANAALSEEGATVRGGRFIASLPISPYDYHRAEGFYAETAVRAYADLASQMRVALLDQSIRSEVKNFRRNAIERCKHLKKVIHLAWEQRSSIRLIRLDWGYRKTAYHQPIYFMGQGDFEARMAQVNKYRQVMLSTLRAMFVSNLAFYAWKIEYSNTTGIHIHWLLGLDNSQNQALLNAGAQIQKAWDTAIANSQTYTFNLNEMSNAERSGLRVIDSQDPDRWEIVGRYVDYFLKGDYTLKLRTPKGMRTFGSSKAVTR